MGNEYPNCAIAQQEAFLLATTVAWFKSSD